MKNKPIVATYYFPNWHCDPRIEALHGKGWTEWRVAQYATPRFPGHEQPKIPLWGYQDESRPEVMAQKITAAKNYGVDAFIFDWYCFNDGPYRDRCLNEGFLQAPNCNELKFALMWCNHNPVYSHPGSYWKPAEENWRGDDITPETFRRETALYIERYFMRPNYLRADGGLYFSILNPQLLIRSLGGEDAAKKIFAEFRAKVRAAGLGELNLNAQYDSEDESDQEVRKLNDLFIRTGFNSVSKYSWWQQFCNDFPAVDYGTVVRRALPMLEMFCREFALPFSPNCLTGWDSSPRTVQSDMYENRGYPFSTIVTGNTPERFEEALRKVKAIYESAVCRSEMIQIPCWNEWTEGTYLEPDTRYGYGYLQAIRNVFGVQPHCCGE